MQSDAIKKGISRAPARAMLKATGLTDADLARPLVAVANTWTEVTPCNFHLRALAEKVKEGVRAAGGTPIEFDTITISDGITMGTEGMKASLISREVIADSIELFVRAHAFDAVVAICGCDKTIPGDGDGSRAAESSQPCRSTAARSWPDISRAQTSPFRTSSKRSARARPEK